MSPADVAGVTAVGVVVGVDLVTVPQAMTARPLVASFLGGWLLGHPMMGLLAGAVLELFALETLPVGAARYPDWGPPAVAAGALLADGVRVGTVASVWPGLLVTVLLAALVARLGGWSMQLVRRANGAAIRLLADRLDRGDPRALVALQAGGFVRDAGRAALLTLLALVPGGWLVREVASRWRGPSALAEDAVLAVAVGAGVWTAWRLFARGGGAAYHEALAREAQFFNGHPYVTSIAIGAAARAELDGEAPERIQRLRQALCGPLGALGDRLIWAGWLPACVALGLALVALGARGWAVAAFLVLYNLVHVGLRVWGLRAGWRAGMRVTVALANPALQRGLEVVGPLAAFAIGFALPAVLVWLARGAGLHLAWWLTWRHVVVGGIGAVVFAALASRVPGRLTGLSLATLVLGVVVVAGILWP